MGIRGNESKATSERGRHLKPLRQPRSALADLKPVGTDPPQITGLKRAEEESAPFSRRTVERARLTSLISESVS